MRDKGKISDYEVSVTDLTYAYTTSSSTNKYTLNTLNVWHETSEFDVKQKDTSVMIDINRITKVTHLITRIEEKIIDYVYEHFNNYINDDIAYICQDIQEKSYEIVYGLLESEDGYVFDYIEDDYMDNYIGDYIDDYDSSVEQLTDLILKEIDFNSIYDLVDELSKQPITMEEKLADIGMSQRDFL